MMGPLGLLSPHPGVSYLFTGADATPANDGEGSLWGIAHANPSTSQVYGGGLGSPPPQINHTIADAVRQLDSRLRVSPTIMQYGMMLTTISAIVTS